MAEGFKVPEDYEYTDYPLDSLLLEGLDEHPPLFGYLASWTYLNNTFVEKSFPISEKLRKNITQFQALYKFSYERPVAFSRSASHDKFYHEDLYATQNWSPNGIYVKSLLLEWIN